MAKRQQQTWGVLAGCGLAVLAATGSAARGVVMLFDSNGFEPSTTANAGVGGANHQGDSAFNYAALNSLAGQPATSGNQFVAATAAGGSTAAAPVSGSVQTYASVFGSASTSNTQFAYVTASQITTTSVGEYYPSGTTYSPVASGNPVVDIIFQMSVGAASAGQPLFGVTAFDGGGVQRAQLMVNGGTGDIVGASTTPNISSYGSLGLANFYSYDLRLNFATQTASLYEAPLNATTFTNLLGTNAFTGAGLATTFGNSALTTYTATATTGGATGSAFFDNFSIQANAVPEPAGVALALTGVVAVAGRRRRSSR